jgi:molybdopterin converting factor small subunit
MRVEVLLFGGAAVAARSDRVAVEVAGEASDVTVRDVLAALHEQHPALKFALPPPESGRLAVNQAFATGEHAIHPGDEVALVTLVGGG